MTSVFTVARYAYEEDCTKSVVFHGGTHLCYAIENPWMGNDKRVSCIPTGRYKTELRQPHESGSFDYEHLILRDVKDRNYILWHIGNTSEDTAGCILPGKGAVHSSVTRSGAAFNEIMEIARDADGIITHVRDMKLS